MYVEHIEVDGNGESFLGERVVLHAVVPPPCGDCDGVGYQAAPGTRAPASWGKRCPTCKGSGCAAAPSRHRDPAFDPFAEKAAPFPVTVGW